MKPWTKENGYEGPAIAFDEFTPAGRALVDHFEWSTASTVNVAAPGEDGRTRVAVVGHGFEGPEIHFFRVPSTEEDREEGLHLRAAEDLCKLDRPYLSFDEYDPAAAQVDWTSLAFHDA